LIVPPEAERVLHHNKPEKKIVIDEEPNIEREKPVIKKTKPVPQNLKPNAISPPLVKPTGSQPPPEGYKIKKKDGKGERERANFDKEEQTYAPVTKSVKTEQKSALGPRHEEHLDTSMGSMQPNTGYGYRPQPTGQKDMTVDYSRNMQPSQRPYGGYYQHQQQQPNFEETEAQFSDDESNFQQGKASGHPSQSHPGQFQQQYPHKYPSQSQGQARPQMQQRDQHQQHMRLQHQYHSGPQQPHPYPSQTQMGQFPPQGQIQQQQRLPVQGKVSMQPQTHTQQGQPMHHHQHHPNEFQTHYSGQNPMQGATKPRPTSQQMNEPMQFQPLSPQPQTYPHFNQHPNPMTADNQNANAKMAPNNRREGIMQIKQIFEKSRNPIQGHETGKMLEGSELPDFEYPCHTNVQKRDSLNELTTMRKGSEIGEQSNVLVFRTLLMNIKKQLPNSIKKKYQKPRDLPSLNDILNR